MTDKTSKYRGFNQIIITINSNNISKTNYYLLLQTTGHTTKGRNLLIESKHSTTFYTKHELFMGLSQIIWIVYLSTLYGAINVIREMFACYIAAACFSCNLSFTKLYLSNDKRQFVFGRFGLFFFYYDRNYVVVCKIG